jgi:uncharacterized protein YnzC (UPF0291/DUF896 family)
LALNSRRIIIQYNDWTFKAIVYTKRAASERAKLRREFERAYRAGFLKDIATNNRPDLEAAGFTPDQIAAMARGKQPRGYSVHHLLPLDDGGDNSSANLLLIRESPEHAALTGYQKNMMQGLREVESREIDFPVPEGRIVVYPPTNDPPTTLPLWPVKGKS